MAQVTITNTPPTTVTAVDEVSGNLTYLGSAKLGSSTSSAVWQILRIQKTGSITLIQYADGNTRYDNVWDDRELLSYS